MDSDNLLDRFFDLRRGPDLPFVHGDFVEVTVGVYAGMRGTVELVAHAASPLKYLVDFRDGTDELFLASELTRCVDAP
jgi:hypothetical protein